MEFHPLSELEAQTSPEVLAKARELFEQENMKITLKALEKINKKYGSVLKRLAK